jgi:very-short-patch-repair endonuclease
MEVECRTRNLDRRIGGIAERQHGAVSRRQLLELGMTRNAIGGKVSRGGLLVLHRGVYAVGHRKLTQEGRWIAAVLACGEGAVLSHRSAAQLWGLVSRSGSIPEVTRRSSFRRRPGIRAHQELLPADEIETVDGIPVTSVSRTLLDLAAIFSRSQLEQAMNEAEVRQLTSRLSLPGLLDRHPGRRGAQKLHRLLAESAETCGVTRSELERRFAALIEAHGLPRPRRNAQIAVRGRFYEVDCLWPEQRVVVELDGRAVHGTNRAFQGDRRRDRILVVEGWRSSRITWLQLRDEPEAIVADLRLLLAERSTGA